MDLRLKLADRVRTRHRLRQPTDGNFHRFKDYLLDMIAGRTNTNDYESDVLLVDQQPAAEPTYSVVELPQPQHSYQPVPEEAIIYNYIPGAGGTASADQHEVAS